MTFMNISVKGLDGKHICILMVINLKSSIILKSIVNRPYSWYQSRHDMLNCLD